MKRFVLALPLIMLAACDSSPDVEAQNAKPSEVAAKMREAAGKGSFVRPGQWEQTVTLLKIEAPGMPPEARTMMQKAMDKAQVNNVCLSKEQAENPREDFFTGADKNCTLRAFQLGRRQDRPQIDLQASSRRPPPWRWPGPIRPTNMC